MSRIAVVGLGPVGLVTGVALAKEGHKVAGIDVDARRVDAVRQGRPPFFEEGLQDAVQRVLKNGRLTVTQDGSETISEADFVFLCVGTPARPDGRMDDEYLRQAAKEVASGLPSHRTAVVIVKSTVVPGTTETILRPLLETSGKPFQLAVNPEFLREGHALQDALQPDRIVLGVDEPETAKALRQLFANAACPIFETDLRTAEAIKYATNAFLATKVAFANELANICSALGVSYDEVIRGVALDPRISPRFLVPGVGFGGSCFPKDVKALVSASHVAGQASPLLDAVLAQNEMQYLQAIRLLQEELGDLKGKRIALLGLSFKGGTDDVRESRAIPLARTLLEIGAAVVGYDPWAGTSFARIVSDVELVEELEEALRGADGCILQADWPQFSELQAEDFCAAMRTPVVIDGRRILDPERMRGTRFRRIG